MTKYLLILAFLASVNVQAKPPHKEFYYTKIWCEAHDGNYGTQRGVPMSDGTFADCITKDFAVEHDFCRKWHECLAQSLHYANLTSKKPMCVLICNPENQYRYIDRFNNALKYINRYEKPVLVIIKE